jgi:hypothetical protein
VSAAQFQADHTGADHRHRLRQVLPVKHFVAGDHLRAEIRQHRQPGRRGTGGDHDARRLDVDAVTVEAIDAQQMRFEKARIAAHLVLVRRGVDAFEDEADEAVALAVHARHHFHAVDAFLAGVDTELRRQVQHVRRLGRRDQELARHAAHTRAGGAVLPALDHHRARTLRPGRPVGHQARRAGADHRNIDLHSIHRISSCPMDSRM